MYDAMAKNRNRATDKAASGTPSARADAGGVALIDADDIAAVASCMADPAELPNHRLVLETRLPPTRGPLAALLDETDTRRHYALHYGHARAPMVRVMPDDHWPGMWRMVWPGGEVSDMGNLARVKDAAADICDRGPPRRDRRRFRWKVTPAVP